MKAASMVCSEFHNIKVAGIAAAVPKNREIIAEKYGPIFGEKAVEKFSKTTGVVERRVALEEQTASDLACSAAEKLLSDRGIERAAILSFDPRDGPDHGLTMDKAQALGERFCAKQFPGHQALICTHPDGHNHSGNIHVHIIINSLRVMEVERKPYMDRASDTQAGAKHRCTAAAMRHFRVEVMALCQEAGLYQIDLLGGSKARMSDREYWAQRKGQLALDTQNAIQGKPPTKFETDKEKLRRKIRAVLAIAVSFEDFAQRLLQRGITVKESRGRLFYLTPDRTKPITARRLGDDFDRTAVGAALERNAARPSRGAKHSIREQLYQPKGI